MSDVETFDVQLRYFDEEKGDWVTYSGDISEAQLNALVAKFNGYAAKPSPVVAVAGPTPAIFATQPTTKPQHPVKSSPLFEYKAFGEYKTQAREEFPQFNSKHQSYIASLLSREFYLKQRDEILDKDEHHTRRELSAIDWVLDILDRGYVHEED